MPPVAERICSLIGVRARFYLSNQTDSPATFGIFNPTVILPRTFPEMREAIKEAVLCHELLHVRRRDWALIFIEEIIRTVFWFHPAVWWLLSRIHLTREQSVDHEVVRLKANRQPYLDSLLEIARKRGRPKAVPAPLFLRERHLVERVALLIKEVSMNRLRLALSLAAVFALLAGTVHFAAGWFPLTGPALIVPEEISAENIDSQQVHIPVAQSDPVPAPKAETQIVPQQAGLKQSTGGESNGKIMLHFTDADLRSFTQQISEYLGLTPLIIDPEVQGTATVHSSEPITKSEVLDLFQLTLKTNNASLIKENGTYMVVPISSKLKTDAASKTILENSSTPSPTKDRGMVGGIVGSIPDGTILPPPPPRPNKLPPRGIAGGILGEIPGGVVGDVVSPTQFVSPMDIPINPNPENAEWIDGNVLQSKLIHKVDPEYPELARRARVKGKVDLAVTVNEEGYVSNVEVIGGHPMFRDAAEKAVKQWKYEPTVLNGKAVPVIAFIIVNFDLPEGTETDESPPM